MKADNSIAFFEKMKAITEKGWENIDPENEWHPQIPSGAKWNPGLSEEALREFETHMGYEFPEPLRNFYRTMNGLDKVHVWTDSDNVTHHYSPFYSYPRDLHRIHDMISWIHERTGVTPEIVKAQGISRIFPVWNHRFIMIDNPGHPILSMHGSDIIFYGKTLAVNFIRDNCHYELMEDFDVEYPHIRGYNWKGWDVPFWYVIKKPLGGNRRMIKPRATPFKGVMTKRLRKIKREIFMKKLAMGRTKVNCK